MCDNIITILSFLASLVSVSLGIVAIVQALKYNKESNQINSETTKMLIN